MNLSESLKIPPEMLGLFLRNPGFRLVATQDIRKYSKQVFFRMAQKLVPDLRPSNLLLSSKAGIRPQQTNRTRKALETDFLFGRGLNSFQVLNSISPAFTSSFVVAKMVVGEL